jgi:hypothetical protein
MEEKDKDGIENTTPNTDINKDGEITPEKIKELKDTVTGLVEELKVERTKKQFLEELVKSKEEPVKVVPTPDDESTKIANVVKSILNQDKVEKAKSNKIEAFNSFILENKEFHPDNDITGLKRKALEEKLNEFNTENIFEVDSFKSKIKDAYRLLGGSDTNPETDKEIKNPYSSSPSSRVTPRVTPSDEFSSKELKLINQGTISKEKLAKLKKLDPDYVEGLLQYVRD